MGHVTVNTADQDNGTFSVPLGRQPTIKMPADLTRLIYRAKAVAEEVSATLKQILDHHQNTERTLAMEL